ncbi:chromosomal replication initiator DnaA [Sphingomonas oleivorans]|uniref:Chromosomal replication initiator DnaA n=1 Tax=Sphingomonas oleivorans TaxID=1735121 RepID=A0A2T5FWK4_9SPHN|nr:DnaA/Hda family protein [Sphingomonas oleivorans]PTQ10162.1 chromosomal replication initiator DnaA [Sphingomonas oleivorans]
MSQFALPFDWPAAEDERDYIVSDANRPIVRHLDHWALWPVMATLLTGPRKSGRSLIARIFTAKAGGEMIDNAERAEEEEIFHAWNRAQSARRPLLIIADAPPPEWEVKLPDLRSRLAATPHIAVAAPDDALIGALIEKLLLARGLAPPPDLVRYLVPRIERSYLGVHRAVDALDALALQRRQGLTVPLARRALAATGVIDDSSAIG